MKKALIFLLAALLVLSMAGCSLGGKTLYLPEKVEVYYDGELSQTMTYQYDENGFLAMILANDGENSGTQVITCDENGNVLSAYMEQLPQASLLLGISYAYTYSSRGNLLSESYSVNGTMIYETNWEYNSKHQVTRAVYKGDQGNAVEYLYEYDKEGKLLAIHGLRNEKQVSKTTFEYDKKGRMVLETQCTDRGIEISKVEYRYEEGKTIAEFRRAAPEMRITYTFDHAGNLIEQTNNESGDTIRGVYTYREVKVSGNSPRRSYTGLKQWSATGLTTLWP